MMSDRYLLLTLVVFLYSSTSSFCRARFICTDAVAYFAQELPIKQRQDYLFYGVQENITSIESCAKFCYETEFCRTAVFDPNKRHCELAYAAVLRCRTVEKNSKTYKPDSTSQVVAVYCIDCPNGKKQPANGRLLRPNSTGGIESSSAEASSMAPHASTPQSLNECFVEQRRKALLNAAFAVLKNQSIEQCRCFCASTWNSSDSVVKCHSFNYFADRRECVFNSFDRAGKHYTLAMMKDDTVTFHEFACENKILAKTYSNTACANAEVKTVGLSSDIEWCIEELGGFVLNGVAGALEHNVTFDECRCMCAGSDSFGKYSFQCKSVMYYPLEKDCVLNTGNRLDRPDMFNKDSTSYQIMYSGIACDNDGAKRYAGAKCQPSSSSASSLVPKVAPAFPKSGSAVELVEATESTKVMLVTDSVDVGDEGKNDFHKQNSKRPSPGDKTDACFLEIPNFLLTGQATVLETNVTLDECKCLCTSSMSKYRFVCLSMQYYVNLRTCLLNRRNRIQEPALFTRAQKDYHMLSYFDFLCAGDESKINSYKKSTCIGDPSFSEKLKTSNDENIKSTTIASIESGRESFKGSSTPFDSNVVFVTAATTTSDQSETNKQSFTSTASLLSFITDGTTAQTTPSTTTSTASKTISIDSLSTNVAATSSILPVSAPQCRYSTFYESKFDGRKLIERTVVSDVSLCFLNCAKKGCKSANLQNFLGTYKYCEIFSDAAVDYPFINYLTYSSDSVYFDGIQCVQQNDQSKSSTRVKPLFIVSTDE